MMMLSYSVYDSKAEIYEVPFYMVSRGAAIRAFAEVANKDDSEIGKYPADYTLFEIGQYDKLTGVYTPYEAKHNIGLALDFVNPKH